MLIKETFGQSCKFSLASPCRNQWHVTQYIKAICLYYNLQIWVRAYMYLSSSLLIACGSIHLSCEEQSLDLIGFQARLELPGVNEVILHPIACMNRMNGIDK
jgi:hypothetical protein